MIARRGMYQPVDLNCETFYSKLCSIYKSEAACSTFNHCTKRQNTFSSLVSVYFWSVLAHKYSKFHSVSSQHFVENYYIDEVSF